MLIARNKRALAKFGDQFQSRKITKIYCALLRGHLLETITWHDTLAKVDGEPRAEVVEANHPGAKPASLTIEPIQVVNGITLARIELHTGRMHQIRIQAASRKLPVLGDATYGTASDSTASDSSVVSATAAGGSETTEAPMALHALSIGFHHPKTAKRMLSTAPVPKAWLEYWPDFATSLTSMSNDRSVG
jgi:23S rRNA-/tRNA-specific pseudouridylate synthase